MNHYATTTINTIKIVALVNPFSLPTYRILLQVSKSFNSLFGSYLNALKETKDMNQLEFISSDFIAYGSNPARHTKNIIIRNKCNMYEYDYVHKIMVTRFSKSSDILGSHKLVPKEIDEIDELSKTNIILPVDASSSRVIRLCSRLDHQENIKSNFYRWFSKMIQLKSTPFSFLEYTTNKTKKLRWNIELRTPVSVFRDLITSTLSANLSLTNNNNEMITVCTVHVFRKDTLYSIGHNEVITLKDNKKVVTSDKKSFVLEIGDIIHLGFPIDNKFAFTYKIV